ncbi:hypothetical protein TBLA_0A08800 [Henningerozyma blattae CBS 6284]|uniref:VPS10 domain-containing protein n=1 Tax=Henningerozyma blattae (strain ATCC 34711 / CBS 6284 / DSM 70876 / NBRC 10599 / NRRL Y-10934 / UCD 77-7) TaxID=1071380 RepID=I2GX17_HENB6|nr:hypothetical protein TBLA_0A08800 [Tetrapisispora blattae CBS 6284]CCH58669.1 hypothetical protein TBLA_0A08800 [Tetrapisispora blattae CBS 6284]
MKPIKWATALIYAFNSFCIAQDSNKDWKPIITRTSIDSTFDIQAFDDSTTLLRLENEHILITTNNGASWEPISQIKDKIIWYDIDPYNKGNRAVALAAGGNRFYLTEDQGRNWKEIKLNIPERDDFTSSCYLSTHPTRKEYFKVHCVSCEQQKDDWKDMFNKLLKRSYHAVSSAVSPSTTVSNLNSKARRAGNTENDKNNDNQNDNKQNNDNGNNKNNKEQDDKKSGWKYVQPKCRGREYVSNNYGKTFREIKPSNDYEQDDAIIFDNLECSFAKISSKSNIKLDDSSLICTYEIEREQDKDIPVLTSVEFFITNDWGRTLTHIPVLEDLVVTNYKILNNHILVVTREDKYNEYSPKKVWVSTDGKEFKEAYLPTQLRYSVDGYIQEDSTGRIILPISKNEDEDLQKHHGMGEILISDSTGLKFEKIDWGLDNKQGYMSLIIPEHLKGTMMGTFVSISTDNKGHGRNYRKGNTKISTDNGISWSNLKIVDPENRSKYSCNIDDVDICSLHSFFVFQNMAVPTAGILMTIGIVGDGTNLSWTDAQTFVSRDGGLTWKLAFQYPILFSFGDMGNVIVAVPFRGDIDDDPESEIYYSLDQGLTWEEYQLEHPIFPTELVTTTPDGSGSTFLLSGISMSNPGDLKELSGSANFLYTIDFSSSFKGKSCQDSDMENFVLNGNECIGGARYTFIRRKQGSSCLVKKVYEDLHLSEDPCQECTEDDYECSFEFTKNENGECVLDKRLLGISDVCSSRKSSIKLFPMQLSRSSKCKNPLKIDKVEVQCNENSGSGFSPVESDQKILTSEYDFQSQIISYRYFDTSSDESFIITTKDRKVYVSNDGGQTIQKIDSGDDEIVEIVFNPYFGSNAYLFGRSGKLYMTTDRGRTFSSTQLDTSKHLGFPIEFNAKDQDTFVYYAGKNCDSVYNPDCHAVAYITRDGGRTFKEMLDDAIHCEFVGSLFKHPSDENLVLCQVKVRGKNERNLVASNDYFENDNRKVFDSIIGYMSTGEYIVVATPYSEGELRAYVTIDGEEFAEAQFPQNINADKQESFTILGSETGSIFLHLATFLEPDAEFGALTKSNSNGTSFVTLERAVNRNFFGFVDFEKVQGLEGIILINVVDNKDQVINKSQEKKLKSKITFNDGSDWSYLNPPKTDSDGNRYDCFKAGIEKCSLHLHGFTERRDKRDTFGSGSAIGMMFGIGNVGEYLAPKNQGSTFFTTNGGATWTELRKGTYQWEFGDHGGILVLVKDGERTKNIHYSIDFGKTWNDYQFSEQEVLVKDIVTVPQDSAMRFLLVTEPKTSRMGATKIISIDFSRVFERQCQLDFTSKSNPDFAYFPIEPLAGVCLFGHQAEYLKKTSSNCYIGNYPLSKSVRIIKNCTCTRNDFECDYNFYKAKDGTCKLVEGLDKQEASNICRKTPELIEYFEPSGYRKIPLSTCQGGLKLDKFSDPLPCPGKMKEFRKKYSVEGSFFFIVWFIPFVFFLACAWFLYDRGIRRNGGFARFGEIRLGDDDLIENNETDKVVNTIIRSIFSGLSKFGSGYKILKRTASESILRIRERMAGRRAPTYSSLLHDQFLDDADDLLVGHDEDANDLENFLNDDGNFDIDNDDTADPFAHPFRDDPTPPVDDISTTVDTSDAPINDGPEVNILDNHSDQE